MIDLRILKDLTERVRVLGDWLQSQAPQVSDEQRHLDAGSIERAYWHHGYRAALADLIEQARIEPDHSPTTYRLQ